MTQNGQGDEPQLPAVRRAHEGVVLPSDGSGPWIPEVAGEHTIPAGGQPWGQPWGPQDGGPQPPQQQPPHIPQQPHQQQLPPPPQQQLPQPYQQQPQPQQPQFPQHMPPQQRPYEQPYQQQPPASQPLPPAAQQYPSHGQQQNMAQNPAQSPQMPAHNPAHNPAHGAPQTPSFAQPLPPEAVPGAGDSDATQFIAPVPAPPGNPAESTQYLGYHQQSGPAPAAAGSDADPTQFLPPVPPAPSSAPYGIRPGAPEDRQPPAEFDNLFRTDNAAGPQAAGETQQLPRFDPQPPYGNAPYGGGAPHNAPPGNDPYGRPRQPGAQQPQYAPEPPSRADAGTARRKSRTPVIAAVVVGCAVIGLGAGALLSGGGSDKKDDQQPAGATSTTGSKAAPEAAKDPAQPQAVALDKLLADSNNSRSAVIAAVGSIRSCQNLPKAASDLRGAAKQRHALVTRLGTLSVDKLPDHAKLTAALTTGWNASATADEQYADWAHAVAANGKKECKHGHAKRTPAAGRGDAASGQATAAKKEASTLWNAIADKYSLTQRRGDQL
ncbi:hypothetical protein OG217_22130 [Streptomyces sp. NBC_01023]|uniref:hypothetical protein n=1 Tax=Streptomyces sp. NBC_01023 TaxID=2903724 RepID=UPI00386358ED|nr:hypothetical protein OG217_22130 [Streptomyces sp. NBC_01023]